jgi:DNA-binding transcriptional regulator YiaG
MPIFPGGEIPLAAVEKIRRTCCGLKRPPHIRCMNEFVAWRERLQLSQIQAARALGLSRRIVQYYEVGVQPIPAHVMLAMSHLTEHPSKLKDARTAPLPLNELQRATLATLVDGESHKLDRKIGKALQARRFAREISSGFVITEAGRAALQRSLDHPPPR